MANLYMKSGIFMLNSLHHFPGESFKLTRKVVRNKGPERRQEADRTDSLGNEKHKLTRFLFLRKYNIN